MCRIRVEIKTYRTVDLWEQDWAALLELLHKKRFARVGVNLQDGRSPGAGLGSPAVNGAALALALLYACWGKWVTLAGVGLCGGQSFRQQCPCCGVSPRQVNATQRHLWMHCRGVRVIDMQLLAHGARSTLSQLRWSAFCGCHGAGFSGQSAPSGPLDAPAPGR